MDPITIGLVLGGSALAKKLFGKSGGAPVCPDCKRAFNEHLTFACCGVKVCAMCAEDRIIPSGPGKFLFCCPNGHNKVGTLG